jgi:ketosteroid isomerase-like protein
MTTITDLDDFKALDPFFRIIEKGLDGVADGGHFFDLLAENVIFDYIITTPGYPRRVEGRTAVAELYRPYGTMIILDRCHDITVHHDIKTGVVVLEHASEGRVVSTEAPYTNRYISVLTIADRKVTHWRDTSTPWRSSTRSDGRQVERWRDSAPRRHHCSRARCQLMCWIRRAMRPPPAVRTMWFV